MNKNISFKNWLIFQEGHHATKGKVSLYPDLYHQWANYPPSDVVTWSADAITYMDPKDVEFKFLYTKKFQPYFWHGTFLGKGKHAG